MKQEIAEFKYEIITSAEKVKELMMNGYFLKHFGGDTADYWGLQNDVINLTPHVIPVEEQYIPKEEIEVKKKVVLDHWPFPGKKPTVTTYKLKG